MSDAVDLRALQSWMQEVIRDPGGAEAGLTSGGSRGRLRETFSDTVIGATPQLGAVERLDLYNRQFRSRMLSCLRQTYPAVRHTLGAELFDEFAVAYVTERPSRSYTLHALRDGFAEYLQETQGELTGPDHSWADFVVDLAELERRFHVVYDGPGVERDPPRDVSLPSEDEWATSTAVPHPSLQLMHARFPIGPYFRSARRNEQPTIPRPAASFIALTRRDYAVVLVELDAPRYAVLEGLQRGRRLGPAARTCGVSGEVLGGWLREWLGQSLIIGIRPAGGAPMQEGRRHPVAIGDPGAP